jgi:hypothetical protein
MSTEVFETVGGWDERFKGWGYEDDAFNYVHMVVLGKVVRRISGVCLRMHHEEKDSKDSEINRALFADIVINTNAKSLSK